MSSPSSNVLTITDNSATITNMSYVEGSANVTPKQSFNTPPSIQKNGKVFTICFECDRKGSSDVAQAFNSSSGGVAHEYAAYRVSDDVPDKLNFFFTLKLDFTTAQGSGSATLNVGQGHTGTRNNWWIGGAIVDSSRPGLVVPVDNTAFNLNIPVSGDVSEYTFSAGTISEAYPIKHIFVLMLENHSFDNMLAMSGIPGITHATTANSNSYNGQSYAVTKGAPPTMPTDPGHEFPDVAVQLTGQSYPPGGPYPSPINNSGFASNYATTTTEGKAPDSGDIGKIMACFDTPSQLPVLYSLATQYTVCDQWFSSLPGPTWPNRFFVHGASSNGLDHSPSTAEMMEWETVAGFSYPNGSIFDALKNDGTTFRLYNDKSYAAAGSVPGWIPQVSSLKGIYLTQVHDLADFAADLRNNFKARYTFIEPGYGDVITGTYAYGSSQHPMDDVYGGEKLIKQVYEAIRNSPVWEQSLLIITYDEHGGFYDSVTPGEIVPPNDGSSTKLNQYGFRFDRLGVRVPAIVVSPWVNAGVDNTVYDHSSVLSTTEKLLGLMPLTDRDAAANDLIHLLRSDARTDCPTWLPDPVEPIMSKQAREPVFSLQDPVPEHGFLPGVLHIVLKTEIEMSDGSAATREALIARFKLIQTRGQADAYIREVYTRVEAVRAAN